MSTFLAWYTLIHVIISLVAIVTGFLVIYDMLNGRESRCITMSFLVTTALTSATGFGFPIERILPAHFIGGISLLALGLAIYGRYFQNLAGKWRVIYALAAVFAQYIDVFVLIVQGFLKFPALHGLAPTQSEPPFAVVQGVNLVAFVIMGVLAVRRFRPVVHALFRGDQA
ncbi:MAG: hypothetical protein U0929_09640 [Planctomycetaceae bacterium]